MTSLGRSCRKLLVGNAATCRHVNQTFQSVKSRDFDISTVQAEGELIHVPAKMLVAHLVIDAIMPALEECPNAFYTVCMDAVAVVDALRVINAPVRVKQAVKVAVCAMLVCYQRRTNLNL